MYTVCYVLACGYRVWNIFEFFTHPIYVDCCYDSGLTLSRTENQQGVGRLQCGVTKFSLSADLWQVHDGGRGKNFRLVNEIFNKETFPVWQRPFLPDSAQTIAYTSHLHPKHARAHTCKSRFVLCMNNTIRRPNIYAMCDGSRMQAIVAGKTSDFDLYIEIAFFFVCNSLTCALLRLKLLS